jgi:hypothetical protein
MQPANIEEKIKLNVRGIGNRQRFLSESNEDLKRTSRSTLVKTSYSELIDKVLGSSSYVFVTVNLRDTDIKRALEKEKIESDGILPRYFLMFGHRYYEALRSGTTTVDAMEPLWDEFFKRLNQKVLGPKFKHHGHFIRWIRVYENPTKRYCNDAANHVHMLVEIPTRKLSAEYNQLLFKHQFGELFSRFIYPLPALSRNSAVLNIIPGRPTGSNPHPKYILKQVINWETAANRLFTSGIPKPKIQ